MNVVFFHKSKSTMKGQIEDNNIRNKGLQRRPQKKYFFVNINIRSQFLGCKHSFIYFDIMLSPT
jgi:hypothetical protein